MDQSAGEVIMEVDAIIQKLLAVKKETPGKLVNL